jgi:Spy/CpxP family protein refolding chaperone
MNKSRSLRIALYAALIFFAGAVTGALVAPLIGHQLMRPPNHEQMCHYMFERLQSGLHLSDEQSAQIKPLIEKTVGDMETIHRETINRVLNRMAETNAQISSLLTPEQKAQFIKMEAERRKRMRQFHHFSGPLEPSSHPPPAP